jgi:hypothetical protein
VTDPLTPLGRACIALLLACLPAVVAAAQPGVALGDPSLAIARDSYAPGVWRSRPLEESVSIIVPWFGSSSELPADRWRTLLCVMDERADIGTPIIQLRYNPARSAVEYLGVFGPEIGGREPTPGSQDERVLGSVRVEGVPFEADRNHCAIITFDKAASRVHLHVASEGSPGVLTATGTQAVASIPPIKPRGKIFLGNPLKNGTSHTGPIFPVTVRWGHISAGAFQGVWSAEGGPRLTDLIGPGEMIGENVIAMLLTTGPLDYAGPADSGRARWWYNGDVDTWSAFAGTRAVRAYRDGEETDDLSTITPAPIFEPGLPWSGFWQLARPAGELRLGTQAVPGNLPRLRAVLNGSRVADHALTAWGLGNSRWANTTQSPASISDPSPLSRSHLLGLRAARPDRDGGLVLLALGSWSSVEGIELVDTGGATEDLYSNWTRFSYGSSFSPSPGTGNPMHIEPGRALRFVVDNPGEAPTQSLALLLERPRGGDITAAMYITDSDGTGRVVQGEPLAGSGTTITTDTTIAALPITAVTPTGCKVQGNTSVISPGDLLVGDNDEVVNVVEAVDGENITVRFAWTTEPEVGTTAHFGPWGYRLVGFTYDAPEGEAPRRGLELVTAGRGRTTLIGLGLRSLDPNRICYVLAGRGGLGQAQQAEREAPGVLGKMADALGVELFFTGLATQSPDTISALRAQLGDRLDTHEFVGTPDVINAQGNTFGSQSAIDTHLEVIEGAGMYDGWAYLQIQDDFPAMLDQYLALLRFDAPHPNGRGMLAAAELWWTRVERGKNTLLANDGCVADINRDGALTPADFSAWIIAYNEGDLDADQNGDARLTPADFSAWILNYGNGCF